MTIDTRKLSETERKAIEAKRAYQRKWRANHKDRVREYNRRYWEKEAGKKENN